MLTISRPFSFDSLGRINTVDSTDATTNNKYMVDKILSLLSTNIRQKGMDTSFGVNLSRAMYENTGNFRQAILDSITRALSTFLPELRIIRLVASVPDLSGQTYVDLEVALPDGTVSAVSVTTQEFNKDGTILGRIS